MPRRLRSGRCRLRRRARSRREKSSPSRSAACSLPARRPTKPCGERLTVPGKVASAPPRRRRAGAAQERRAEGRAGAGASGGAETPAPWSVDQLTLSRPKALISWSSGKDSAFALHEVRRAGEFEIVGALTTVTETFGRVSIHGVRQEILRAQLDAAALAPPLWPIPYPCPNEIYEARIGEA